MFSKFAVTTMDPKMSHPEHTNIQNEIINVALVYCSYLFLFSHDESCEAY